MVKMMTTLDVPGEAGQWLVGEAMRRHTDIASILAELIYAEMARRSSGEANRPAQECPDGA